MGLDMTYIAGEERLSFKLSATSADTMKVLAKKGFKKEVEAIFGVSDFDRETPTGRRELLESIDRLIEAIERDSGLLPYTYSFKIETPPGSGVYSVGSGLASGIRIGGELYSIEGGLGRCELTRDWWDENGVYHGDKPQDIRNLKSLKTDSDGEIAILKRRRRTCFVKNLKELKMFLAGQFGNFFQSGVHSAATVKQAINLVHD